MLLLVASIVVLGMVKEGLSDAKRSKSDKKTNESMNRRIVKVSPVTKDLDKLTEARRKAILSLKGIDSKGDTQFYAYYS